MKAMALTEYGDTDAAGSIEISIAVLVIDGAAVAAHDTSTTSVAQRQPNDTVTAGAITAIATQPRGTPVCLIEKKSGRDLGSW